MKKLLLALSLFLPMACTSGGNALEKYLSSEELEFARKTVRESYIRVYNQVAQEGATDPEDVIERYFSNGLRICATMGTMDTLIPGPGFTRELFALFDGEVLGRFVEYDPETCRCIIRKDGRYMDVLSKISLRNGFFKGLYKFMQASDGCNGVPYIIAINYKNIDFEKEDEQFIAYLALLTRPDAGVVEFSR